jgi:LPS sulfotransferase NodH
MKPELSIIVVGVQRSGTSLLCEALKATGVAGTPEEYFLPYGEADWVRDQSQHDIRSHIAAILRRGITPNRVFGTNLMWNTHCDVQDVLHRLPEFSELPAHAIYDRIFGNTKYVWIRRRDRVRQAVSWAKAAQTGIFSSVQARDQEARQKPEFDFTFINNLHRLVHG